MAADLTTVMTRLGLPFTRATTYRVHSIRERAVTLRQQSYARYHASDRSEAAMARWTRDSRRICAAEDSCLLRLRDAVLTPPVSVPAVDPGMAARDRQLLALRAAAPLRPHGGQHSADLCGLPMFEPTLL